MSAPASALEFDEALIEGLGSGLLAVDAGGTVRRVNAAGLELLGLPRDRVLGCAVAGILALSPLLPLLRKVRATGERLDRVELELERGRERVPLGVTLVPLRTPGGAVEGIIANFRDLTQVRRLAELVRRGQRLGALGEMAAGVAHEIRNPLNSIRGFVELILERAQGEDRRYMQIVLEEVERINHIVGSLLDFGRQESLVLAPMDLGPVLHRAAALVAGAAERRHIRLRNSAPEPLRILGSGPKLEQVFLNLLQNAVEAVPDGGEVSLGAVPRAEAGREGWAVRVSDNGPGIAPEDLERLFTPFFTRKERGTGLGLAVCHKIVEAHGGRIDVESRPGAGTAFSVWLPGEAAA